MIEPYRNPFALALVTGAAAVTDEAGAVLACASSSSDDITLAAKMQSQSAGESVRERGFSRTGRSRASFRAPLTAADAIRGRLHFPILIGQSRSQLRSRSSRGGREHR
jgi:hypothetical protein